MNYAHLSKRLAVRRTLDNFFRTHCSFFVVTQIRHNATQIGFHLYIFAARSRMQIDDHYENCPKFDFQDIQFWHYLISQKTVKLFFFYLFFP